MPTNSATTDPLDGRPRRGGYTRRLKRELLQLPQPLPCCRQTLLAALTRKTEGELTRVVIGKRWRVRLRRWLREHCGADRVRAALRAGKLVIAGIDSTHLRRRTRQRVFHTGPRSRHRHCLRALLIGLLLRSGYCLDPHRGYHLELLPPAWARKPLLIIGAKFRLTWHTTVRRGRTVFYLKDRQSLHRWLLAVGLAEEANRLADLLATRDLAGQVNRQVNCDTANLHKQVQASERQIERIRTVLDHADADDALSDALRAIARLRVEHPLDTLDQLGQRCRPPLTKSAVNHRLRRIEAVFRELFAPPDAADETNREH